jgi:hypothetical protein
MCDVKGSYGTPGYQKQELIVHNYIERMQEGAKEVPTSR